MTSDTQRPGVLVALLAFVSLVGYALRSNITIAQELMAPELGLTMADMGFITAAGFQLAYAVFQIPAGLLGDRYGAKMVLGLAIAGWAVASFASGLVGAGGSAFLTLFAARVLLGVSQAATYPVGCMAIHAAIPVGRRTTANAIFISTALLGSALAPLTLAPLMVATGWRAVFVASGIVGLVAAILWFIVAPAHRPPAGAARRTLGGELAGAVRLLGHRDLLVLSIAYLLHSAVFFVFIFWSFRYLVDGRGFGLVASGFWASIPAFTAFALGPFGGVLADRLGRRFGIERARRRVAIGCLLISAALLLAGANFPDPYVAVALLAFSVASLNAAEGPFWATATTLGGANAGTAGGVLNLMGNLGGVISIWAVPLMRDPLGWTGLLAVWAGVAVLAALLWLGVRTEPAGAA